MEREMNLNLTDNKCFKPVFNISIMLFFVPFDSPVRVFSLLCAPRTLSGLMVRVWKLWRKPEK